MQANEREERKPGPQVRVSRAYRRKKHNSKVQQNCSTQDPSSCVFGIQKELSLEKTNFIFKQQ